MAFEHVVRPRFAEVDMQGIVFNAHWLTYFDDACTRFFEHLGYPADLFTSGEFDFVVAHAELDWKGSATFNDEVRIAVEPTRLGTSSFDLTYRARVGDRPACEGVITYISVEPRGEKRSTPIPDDVRKRLEAAME